MFRTATAAVGAAALIPAGMLIAAPAGAHCASGCAVSMITVRVSDKTPASGQEFIARGTLTMWGLPADGHLVKVQTLRAGSWEQISGARVTTDSEGKYRVRLILQSTGARTMRVVGVRQGMDQENQYRRFTVRVH